MKAISKLISIVSVAVLSDRIGTIQGASPQMFESMDMHYYDHRNLASSSVASGSGIVSPKFTIPPVSYSNTQIIHQIFTISLGDEINVTNAEIYF